MADISSIAGIDAARINKLLNSDLKTVASDDDKTFAGVLDMAKSLLTDTDNYVKEAQQAEVDFALGKISSTHELSIIQQKANVALQYTVAIRDKLIEAYKEIMQIQI
ncbi:MAG TPA: flagellar hook-basal body protein FliE [Eubacterium sp.]|jgi:flagellar hook-basal body complex protein FliE|nr:flagellar hook-basal body complex protein FliE [Lachnospiraceae bacterium]HAZ90589.1 flagellar hook-basal body protein FliE [Eubacterium sp.]HBZ52354.1 flagellar hook-basal body protein FliE [Eubacterium sp.]